MKRLTALVVFTVGMLSYGGNHFSAATYVINGEFDGCEYGKLYELTGGGILECREYNYFYDYSPVVRTDGREVIAIGDEVVRGYIHDGSVVSTQINGEFDGCEYDKRYELLNGLVFVCATYRYAYAYGPPVKIFIIGNSVQQVMINGEEYDGQVYR